ncbi:MULTISPECIES: DegV family protein [unclassified Dehalobacter]|uniref:DegV family protein n=1 Tax=unclassified Dehalobacter TaxID=2635733 RepID=UPI000E6C7EFF|nr:MULTISPECIES: DegV family protein [unclassified Dehalobacter]RJE48019.1 EDD domain protein [Dehalobacter sp. MCB1]TCX50573.1 DegV family protein [Dehalobacter sp. 14DCB1]TCX52183.1 DegV family protein [Dehalobacter sp. 12DCB1]
MPFQIVVDSASDIPRDLAEKIGIVVVPMPVNIDGVTYAEGIDIFPDKFYADFKNYKELPKTSQPNLNLLKDAYEKVLAEGKEVIAIHLSSGLSSTCQTAVMVREMCSAPEKIHIIDSLGASLGFGLQAILTSEILLHTDIWQEIEPQIMEIRNKMRYIFTIDTLEYLVKGGRLSKTAGFVAGLLDVKPILHMNVEGKIDVFNKVRSRKAAIRKLIEIMKNEIVEAEKQVIGISHSACMEEAEALAEEIKNALPVKDVIISDIGCVVGSHVGPGTLALYYQSVSKM